MISRSPWNDAVESPPDPGILVSVRVHGRVRPDYYCIEDRWYSLEDLDRWRMNTSRYWPEDRSWYLDSSQIEGWR